MVPTSQGKESTERKKEDNNPASTSFVVLSRCLRASQQIGSGANQARGAQPNGSKLMVARPAPKKLKATMPAYSAVRGRLANREIKKSMYGPLASQLFEEARQDVYRYSPEPFRLASGKESHHYFNCKKITMIPDRLRLLALTLRDEVLPAHKLQPVAAGGLTLGADPIAIAYALVCAERGQIVYPLIVRKERKDHGTGKQIEGEHVTEGEVLLIDDVVTTGGSSLQALHTLRQAGYPVAHAFAIVDREEGAREALQAEGVELIALFRKSDFAGNADQGARP